jgi:hypothetical protein
MPSTATTNWLELARRAGNGVELALLWDATADRLKVVVSDAQFCHHLDLQVGDPGALSAFRELLGLHAAPHETRPAERVN